MSEVKLKNVLFHMLVNDEHGILYCYVPKVACSNWKRVMAVLDHKAKNVDEIKFVDHDGVKRLRRYSDDEIQYRLDNYFKFMFVREPLQRLVSAYKDKLTGNNRYYTAVTVNPIIKRFRALTGKGNEVHRPGATLEEFFMHLDSKPTRAMDEHWMPMNELCKPCAINYDFIGTIETIDEDSEELLEELNLRKVVHFPKQQKMYKNKTGPTTKELLNETPKELIQKIINKYRLDYELFNYSLPDLNQL